MLKQGRAINAVVSFGLIAASMTAAVTARCEVAHRVNVAVLKQESSLHTSVGNRDVYRVRIMPKRGEAFDAFVIDRYPAYAENLPLMALGKDATVSMKLVRTSYCDQATEYDGKSSTVRCFTIDRRSWKAAKSVASDAWWK